jgi:hypothetical protein
MNALRLVLLSAVTVAACAGAGPGSTTPAPSLKIDHARGATDVVLRFEQSGGFVPIEFLATQGPIFSLYGDGTAIFRDPTTDMPAAEGGIIKGVPYQAIKLPEEEVQGLLEYALGVGSLGVAQEKYDLPVMDVPAAVFTIHAGGVDKTVTVNGLGFDTTGNPDAGILASLDKLSQRLQHFGGEMADERPWLPSHYRGILSESAFNPPIEWPWKDIQPVDFVQSADPNDPQFRMRVMTPDEVGALKLTGFEGGLQGVAMVGPDGNPYSFMLRPLLPDETK